MTLTPDKKIQVFEEYLKLTADLSQAMKYCLNSRYQQSVDNFIIATASIHEIIAKLRS